VPKLTFNRAAVFGATGATGRELVREDRPLAPGSDKARIRRQQEDVLLEAGACVARLPDFFGRGAEIAILNDALQSVRDGRA